MSITANESPIRKVGINQADKSSGFRTRRGFFKQFATGPGVKSYLDVSFTHDVDLLGGDYFIPATANPKNRLWVEIAPNTDLSLFAASAAIANNVVATDSEVILNLPAKLVLDGFLSSDAAMQTNEVYFRLTSIPGNPTDFTDLKVARWDSTNSKLISPSGEFGLTATANDKIYVTVRFEDGSYIAPGEFVRLGEETIGSSNLPAGTVIRFIILNEDTSTLDVGFNMVYLHS